MTASAAPTAAHLWALGHTAPPGAASLPERTWVPADEDLTSLHAFLTAGYRFAVRALGHDEHAAELHLAWLLGMPVEHARNVLRAGIHARVRPGTMAALLTVTGVDVPALLDRVGSCVCRTLTAAGSDFYAQDAYNVEIGETPGDRTPFLSAGLGPSEVETGLLAGAIFHGPARPGYTRLADPELHTVWTRTLWGSGLVIPPDILVAEPGATLADLAAVMDRSATRTVEPRPWVWRVPADGMAMHPLSAVPDGQLRSTLLDLLATPHTDNSNHPGPAAHPAQVPAAAAIGIDGSASVVDPDTGVRRAAFTLKGTVPEDVATGDRLVAAIGKGGAAPRVWSAGGPAVEHVSG